MTSIRSNLVAFALLATLAPAIGLAIMSYVTFEAIARRDADRELRLVARSAASDVTLFVRERAQDLRILSAAPLLLEAAQRTDVRSNGDAAGTYLRSVQGRLDGFVALALLDTGAAIVARSGDDPVTAAVPAPDTVGPGFVASTAGFDDARGVPTLALQVPILASTGAVVGTLSGVIDLTPALTRLGGAAEGPAAEIMLAAGDGVPLAGAPELRVRTPFAAATWVALRADDGAPARYVIADGREMLGVAARATSTPLHVVAQRERASVYGAWTDVARWFALLVAGLVALLVALAWWMGRSIVAPLAMLTTAADRVAAGDLDVDVRDDSRDEVGRLARAFSTMTARLRAAQAQVAAVQADLTRKNAALTRLATRDSLTGLANRKAFDAILLRFFAEFAHGGAPFALFMVSVDDLDRVNADFGYPAGDELLIDLAALLRQDMTTAATVARFAGERFVALVPAMPLDAALELAERIRALVDQPGFGGAPRPITVSVGVAQARTGDATGETILFRADHALHEARRAGGNVVRSSM